NDEVAAKDLTLEGFIDGEVVNSLVGADSGGVNDYFLLTVLDNQWNFGATGVLTRMGDEGTLYLICKTCDLQMRITTALGTNQEIHALLEYDAWEEL
ncbi:hypothetical protein MUO79_05805, partial [Candidatus Bathyarchaeota archaeon]|nr:hypothetical protein [Candidatus Bathyarchaeota archaeon]